MASHRMKFLIYIQNPIHPISLLQGMVHHNQDTALLARLPDAYILYMLSLNILNYFIT